MTSPASRTYLSLWLPWLAEDAWRARDIPGHAGPAEGSVPDLHDAGEEDVAVFIERDGNAVRLTAVGRAALQAGLTPGLTLADARARAPALHAVERDRAAEARLLGRIVAGCARYTPAVAAEPPDGLVLDATGCLEPWGDATALADDLLDRLAAGGVAARAGHGGTPQAARARARFGDAPDLRDLPVAALEAAPDVTTALRRAGLRTVGDLARRPRALLAARFGDLALRLARLLEEEDPRITPARTAPPVAASRRFAEPIGRVEDAFAVLRDLVAEAAVTLAERQQGGRLFAARLFRSDGHVAALRVATGRPTRDPALVMRLFDERLAALADPLDPGFGFDAVRLDVARAEPLAPAQEGLDAPADDREALGDLLDRLATRLGPARIRRLGPGDSHIPECAEEVLPAGTAPAWQPAGEGEPPLRPLRLLHPPEPVEAVLFETPDGPPARFRWAGIDFRVVHEEGPERIAAEWWRRRDRGGQPRDYFRVEDEAGRRFWLFRRGQAAWFLHGLFA